MAPGGAVVTELAVTVLKGGRLAHPEEILLEDDGVADDRRFFVISTTGKQLDAVKGTLNVVSSEWISADRQLTLHLPTETIRGEVELGQPITGRIPWDGNREITGRKVLGDWSDALSRHLGEQVHLVERLERPALDVAPVTLVSTESVTALEQAMEVPDLGSRRFRMTVTIEGVEAHQEDTWDGLSVEVGECRLAIRGSVPRCAAVTHDPATGVRDHSVLKGIIEHRPSRIDHDGRKVNAPFGVYGYVVRAGRIRVGDRLALTDEPESGWQPEISKSQRGA